MGDAVKLKMLVFLGYPMIQKGKRETNGSDKIKRKKKEKAIGDSKMQKMPEQVN